MLFDSHCHTWRKWPYAEGVPDLETRGSVDTLLWEMDENGVDRAAVVCVRMGKEVSAACENDDNNDYVAAAVKAHPDRLVMLADVDCFWTDTEYHKPRASERLEQAAERYDLCAFTHYVDGDNDGWLVSEEGREFFACAARLNLIASLALSAPWFSDLREVALTNPTMPILLHHLGMLRLERPTLEDDLAALVANADLPNLYLKLSGLHYLSENAWDFPFEEVQKRVLRPLLAAFGAERFVWGSDYSAASRYITYSQSLELVRSRIGLSNEDINLVQGATLDLLLRSRRPHGQRLQSGAGDG